MNELSILGSTKLRTEDGSLDHSFLAGPKRLALLAYLILTKPHHGFHRRDKLITLFWPEKGQKSARNALSNMLYHIRSTLGKEIIESRGNEEISINLDEIWCDAIAFEEALDQGNPRKALELYRDNLLLGFHVSDVSNEFQDWLDAERERLKLRAAEGAWTLAKEAEETENVSAARNWGKKAAKFTPYNEDTQARLITLLNRLGYRSEALETYEEFASRLRSEWEMEPTDKLKSLVKNMQEQSEKKESFATADPNEPHFQEGDIISTDGDSLSSEPTSKEDRSAFKWVVSTTAVFLILIVTAWFYWIDAPVQNKEAPAISQQSVAVLPFTYINAPDSTDYFSLGITEEILSKLARVSNLSVISRTSVMQYQNTDKTVREIARELGVSTVVEGSVQKHEDQVRITAQLIDAETDQHLWGDTYDRQIENILLVQSEVAARIADALQTELLPYENSEYTPNQNVDELAYQSYLQAKHMLDIHNPDGIVKSVEIFKESISIDSTFAPAYGGLSLAYLYSGLLSRFDDKVTGVEGMNLRNAANLSLESSNQALSINPNVVEAYLAQAIIYQRIYKNWEQSEEKFLKALSLNPNHSDVRVEYGVHLLYKGNINEALIHMEKAVAVDPLSWTAHHGLGYTYYCNREYEKAIRELETSIKLGSRYPDTKKHLSLALLKRSQELFSDGRDEQAMAMIERGSSVLNEIWGTNTGWKETVVFAAMGNKGQTIQSIHENPLPFPPMLYSLLLVGQTDEVLELLDNRLNFSINRTYVDPIFDTVRDNPRFQEIVEKDLAKAVF
ncbi:MAG: hypothetical protein GVY20_05395 [Bacteroidetes bacterium]|jgi:TolB-like protein/DNA-binding SARP family transcriptional activator/lipoprotein NlpI|nr:hypothetical protein [Bacteroidota bacterium]